MDYQFPASSTGVDLAEGHHSDDAAPKEMVLVPGGVFTMGDTRGNGFENDLPTHSVTVDSYYIDKCEVTQKEWNAVMGSWDKDMYDDDVLGYGDNFPVFYSSWYAILKFCNLRSINDGLTPVYTVFGSTNPYDWGSVPDDRDDSWDDAICDRNANGYRLPTEAEWEYAARGATNTPDYLYSGSDDINAVAWYESNSDNAPHPVGTKTSNSIGIFDMSGNVWEWVWDWYEDDYYTVSPSINPTGPMSGSGRVIRGGSWEDHDADCQVSPRDSVNPYGLFCIGFRLCRSAK